MTIFCSPDDIDDETRPRNHHSGGASTTTENKNSHQNRLYEPLLSKAKSILNVSSSENEIILTKASIDRAFRKHSLKAHPDKKSGSEEMFKRGKWAKEVLMRHVNGEDLNGFWWEEGDGDGERESLRKPTYDWKRTRGKKKKKEEEEDEMNGRKRDDDAEQSDRLKDGNDRHDPEEEEQEEQIKLRTLHETHKHAVTVMSVLKGDGCVFIASGDAGGEVVIYEKKSKRIVSINAGTDVKRKLGAIAALEWNGDGNNNTRGQTISLAVTFAKGCDAHVYEFLPIDLSVKSKAVLRGTHSKRITCCAFNDDILVLGSADGTSSVWAKESREDASNEWTRKRMLRHHSDKEKEATPKSAIPSTLIHFSGTEKDHKLLHIVTSDASGRFKVWEGDSGHLEKLAKIHDVNWSGCGGIVKTALMRKHKSTSTTSNDEKVYVVTSHFDSNSDISRALCWDAFSQNDDQKTPIRGYVHEYPKKGVPFYGRLSSFDFFTPPPSGEEDKRRETIAAEPLDSDTENDAASSSSLAAFVAASTLTVVDTSANTLLFSLDLPSTSKRTKISPNGLLVASALTTGQISIVSIDDAEVLFEINDDRSATSTSPSPPPLRRGHPEDSANATPLWTLEWLDGHTLIYGNQNCALCEVQISSSE